ncbi:MAG: hypothetical protein ACI9XO_000182 [Paraglaciecola sp.]|jgi:hypothetical protein
MNYILLTGIIGSIILVVGAAWKDSGDNSKPTQSIKNWLFAIGAVVMLMYAILGYLNDGKIFYVILEILVLISCILMMTTWNDRLKTSILAVAGTGLIIWSLFEFTDPTIIIFVLGLIIIAFGYAFKMGTLRRSVALTAGSILIAAYSYLEPNWIFFGLNLMFGLFSGYYILEHFRKEKFT